VKFGRVRCERTEKQTDILITILCTPNDDDDSDDTTVGLVTGKLVPRVPRSSLLERVEE